MEAKLQEVTQQILQSYAQVGGLNNADGPNMPSKLALGLICENLLKLLFPGFHDEQAVHSPELPELTRLRLSEIADLLEDQICKSFRLVNPACPHEKSREVLFTFLEQLASLRELLKTDIEAAYEGDPAASSYEEIVLAYPCIEAISIQRVAHILYKKRVPLLPRMMTEWGHGRTGIDIHPGAQIGTHFFIDHGTGVVIGETCRIGNHVKLYHGVTLGARSFQKDDRGKIVKGQKRHPDVEDGVTIYPNSTILGGETIIGEYTTIGANVFLMQSVPRRSLVFYEEKQLKVLSKEDHTRVSKPTVEVLEWSI